MRNSYEISPLNRGCLIFPICISHSTSLQRSRDMRPTLNSVRRKPSRATLHEGSGVLHESGVESSGMRSASVQLCSSKSVTGIRPCRAI
jgi:hypothetical protein